MHACWLQHRFSLRQQQHWTGLGRLYMHQSSIPSKHISEQANKLPDTWRRRRDRATQPWIETVTPSSRRQLIAMRPPEPPPRPVPPDALICPFPLLQNQSQKIQAHPQFQYHLQARALTLSLSTFRNSNTWDVKEREREREKKRGSSKIYIREALM